MRIGRLSEIGMALAYSASALAIIAMYRVEIGDMITNVRNWYISRPKPTRLTGKLAEDVQSAVDSANAET